MQNITFDSLAIHMATVANELKRMPLVTVSHEAYDVRIQTNAMTASLTTRGEGIKWLSIVSHIGSAVAPMGNLSEVESQLLEMRCVVDALHRGVAMSSHLRIWVANCPCDTCGSTGKKYGPSSPSPCDACKGTGTIN